MQTRFLLAPALLASVPHGELTVGQPDDGADFTDLGAALAAASPGEVVFVLPGSYEGAAVDQSVTLVGSGSDATFLFAPAVGVPHLTVAGLAAGEQVRVVGFRLEDTRGADPGFGHGVELRDNAGSVTLADVFYVPSTADTGLRSGGVEALLDIENCDQVILDRVRFDARGLDDAISDGMYGLHAESSFVTANDSDFMSGGGLGNDGRSAARIATAELWLNACNFIATDGAAIVGPPGSVAPAGGAGITATLESRIELFGNQGNLTRGGDGGRVNDIDGNLLTAGDGGPGCELTKDTTGLWTPATTFVGGFSSEGVQAPLFVIDASSFLGFLPAPQPGISVSSSLVSPGESFTLEAAGLNSSPLFFYFGIETLPPLSVPPYRGFVQLVPLAPAPFPSFNLGPTGTGERTLTIPAAIPPGISLYFQALKPPEFVLPGVSLPAFVQIGL